MWFVFCFCVFFFSSRRRHTRCALVMEFRRVLFRSARMIDPRGHRFGAAVSSLILIGSFVAGWVLGVFLVLLSIGVSAAFGLRYSIYGEIGRASCRERVCQSG